MPFWLVNPGIDPKIEEKKSDTVWLVPGVSDESEWKFHQQILARLVFTSRSIGLMSNSQ